MAKNQEEQFSIDRILDSLGQKPLFIITIRRTEPEWCAEYLGRIYVGDDDDDILNRLQREFGGGTFRIQIRDGSGRYLAHRTVKIGVNPLKYGRAIRPSAG